MKSARKSLEEKLKEGLIAKRTEENYQMLQEPGYQRHSQECLLGVVRSLGIGLGHGKRAGKADKMEEDICALLDDMVFNNPDNRRNIALDCARREYFNREEVKAFLDGLYLQFEKTDVPPKLVARLRKEDAVVCAAVDTRVRIFANLLEIAQRRGLQYALTDAAESEAVRRVFPTRRQYLAYQESSVQTMRDYFDRVQDLLLKDDELGKQMAGMMGGVKAAVEKFSDEVVRESALRRADKIYGSAKRGKK